MSGRETRDTAERHSRATQLGAISGDFATDQALLALARAIAEIVGTLRPEERASVAKMERGSGDTDAERSRHKNTRRELTTVPLKGHKRGVRQGE